MPLFGQSGRFEQLPTLTPQQGKYLRNLMTSTAPATGQAQGYYQEMLDPSAEAYQRFAAPARRDFQQTTVPAVAGRFASSNVLRSSGFQNRALRAASDLETNIAAQRAQMQAQAAQGLTGIGAMGQAAATTPTFQNIYRPPTGGFLGNVLSPLAGGLGGSFLGPLGAAAGSALGGSAFGVPGSGIGTPQY